MSEEQADEARGRRMGNRLGRMGRCATKALQVFFTCIRYGVAYGVASGATLGVFGGLFSLLGPLGGLLVGAYAGAVFGAIGGGVFALVGSIVPGRMGWIIAGLLSGAVCPAWFRSLPAETFLWDHFVISACVTSVLLGGFLGLALNQGLRRGISPVPGVENLAAIILDRNQAPEGLAHNAESADGHS
jgi:hypothetical protein